MTGDLAQESGDRNLKTTEPYANRGQIAEVHANLGCLGMTIAQVYANLG